MNKIIIGRRNGKSITTLKEIEKFCASNNDYIMMQTIKEARNAFNILQLKRDRSSECHYNLKSC